MIKILILLIPFILVIGHAEAKNKFWKSNQTWDYINGEDLSKTVINKTSNYNMAADDYMITADGSSNTIDIKVPNPALVVGREYVIKATNTAFLVKIIPFGSELFDNAESINFTINNASVTIISIGSKWLIK